MYSLYLYKQVESFFQPLFDSIKLSYDNHKIDLLFLSNLFITLNSIKLDTVKISYYSNIINVWTYTISFSL